MVKAQGSSLSLPNLLLEQNPKTVLPIEPLPLPQAGIWGSWNCCGNYCLQDYTTLPKIPEWFQAGCTANDAHHGEKNRVGSSRGRYSPPVPIPWDESYQQQHRILLGILENVGVQVTCNPLWRQQVHKRNTRCHQGKSSSQRPQACPSSLLEWEKNWKLPRGLSRTLMSTNLGGHWIGTWENQWCELLFRDAGEKPTATWRTSSAREMRWGWWGLDSLARPDGSPAWKPCRVPTWDSRPPLRSLDGMGSPQQPNARGLEAIQEGRDKGEISHHLFFFFSFLSPLCLSSSCLPSFPLSFLPFFFL